MSQKASHTASRREFLKHSGRIAAASALAAVAIPHVHAAENNTIQVALIGCGGRGTGAAADALSVKNGPVKLVAMADAFQDRLTQQLRASEEAVGPQGRRGRRSQVRRPRRLQEGDRLPEAGRRGHFCHAPGLSLGPLRLRHREGRQRFHGEAGHGRRPDHPQNAGAWPRNPSRRTSRWAWA